MPATAKRLDRIERRAVDKFTERRAELAEAALQTLAELGYARTSLREIAQKSEFSHGVLHYYFKDKADLITCCVRQYKIRCITRYSQATASAVSYDELLESFLEGLGDSIRHDGAMHRLWFDLRTQSLFESDYRAEVVDLDKNIEDMIWLIVSRLFELAGVPNNATPAATYAMIDGLFLVALFRHFSGDADAIAEMQTGLRLMLTQFIKPA
jgi:AcrR family transcriptional regulator